MCTGFSLYISRRVRAQKNALKSRRLVLRVACTNELHTKVLISSILLWTTEPGVPLRRFLTTYQNISGLLCRSHFTRRHGKPHSKRFYVVEKTPAAIPCVHKSYNPMRFASANKTRNIRQRMHKGSNSHLMWCAFMPLRTTPPNRRCMHKGSKTVLLFMQNFVYDWYFQNL